MLILTEYNITDISNSFYELYNEDKGEYVYLNNKLEPIYLKDDYSYLTCFDNENEIACVYYYGSNERVYTYIVIVEISYLILNMKLIVLL